MIEFSIILNVWHILYNFIINSIFFYFELFIFWVAINITVIDKEKNSDLCCPNKKNIIRNIYFKISWGYMRIYWPDSNLSLNDLEKNRIMAISINVNYMCKPSDCSIFF